MNKKVQPEVSVGIVTSMEIRLFLNGIYRDVKRNLELTGAISVLSDSNRIILRTGESETSVEGTLYLKPDMPESSNFRISDVTIGIGFHWQKKEDQVFSGLLKIISGSNGLTLINIVPVEDYLVSVISSEMSAMSSEELLKAHAVISRGWLLAQIEKGKKLHHQDGNYQSSFMSDDEIIRWYDREDHHDFEVCADDHCQRYQGITKSYTPAASKAVRETTGEVLEYNDQLCDTRFSKCCGGVSEVFENAWEPINHPYLQRVRDIGEDHADLSGDLKDEMNAREWILSKPQAFCNTTDNKVLSQVLNDYDQSTHDFYRWKVTYTGAQLGELIKTKTGIEFGNIHDLVPIQRGVSGRLIKLKIMGTLKTMIIGKELEIRKALSPTHLYSSAFVVDKAVHGNEITFNLNGAGWGHGVGLCQIGAAVMGEQGYQYRDILKHYFRGAILIKRY